MGFTFIHTGDLHLDSPLAGLAKHDDPRARTVSAASRTAFAALCDEALARKVDAVLIAGDLWDGEWRDVDVAHFVQRQAGRLRDAGIGVYAVLGNHDAQSRVTGRIRAIDAVTFFPVDAPASIDIGPAVLHGVSFADPVVSENVAVRYPPAVAGRINVGLLHTSLDGREGHGRYAPCTPGDLAAKGYDYWALGHVHTREVIAHEAAAKGGTIAYCGVLQGRHVRETGAKGAILVHIEPGAPATLTDLHVAPIGWHDLGVDVGGDAEPEAAVKAALEALVPQLTGSLSMVRIRLKGRTARHHSIHANQAELAGTIAVMASGLAGGAIVIEDLRVETEPERTEAPALPAGFEAVLGEAAADPAVAEAFARDVQDILNEASVGQARAALRDQLGELTPLENEADAEPLLREAVQDLAAKLGALQS